MSHRLFGQFRSPKTKESMESCLHFALHVGSLFSDFSILDSRTYRTDPCDDTGHNDWIDSIFSKYIIKSSAIESVECVFCYNFLVFEMTPIVYFWSTGLGFRTSGLPQILKCCIQCSIKPLILAKILVQTRFPCEIWLSSWATILIWSLTISIRPVSYWQ